MNEELQGLRNRRSPAGLRLFLLGTVAVVLIALTGVAVAELDGPPDESPAATPLTNPARLQHLAAEPGRPGPGGDAERSTLVLYDGGGSDAELAHSYAVQAANWLHGAARGRCARSRSTAAATCGSTTGRSMWGCRPTAGCRSRSWPTSPSGRPPCCGWATTSSSCSVRSRCGRPGTGGGRPGPRPFRLRSSPTRAATSSAAARPRCRSSGWSSSGTARPRCWGRRDDGSTAPWAVRSGALTYVAEVPFSYVDTKDRYLAAADLVLRLVAPDAPERRRALIRIEDVGPNTDPEHIRRIADSLSARGVPFSLATYPYYRDPRGTAHQGEPASFRLVDAPEVVEALQYARERGGTIVMHGYTHQYESLDNPYDGTSGGDYEFYAAHVDEQNFVQLDGPVPADSRQWAADRLAIGRAEFVRAGLPDPDIFEFPHYTGSAASYQAAHDAFGVRYDHGTYFAGQCPGGQCATDREIGADGLFQQYFPYPVRDVYGSVVVPENLKNISVAYNNNAPRSAQDIVDAAGAMTVVTDGVASTFFHPFLPVEQLEQVVDGIEGHGFRFVTPYDVIGETGAE